MLLTAPSHRQLCCWICMISRHLLSTGMDVISLPRNARKSKYIMFPQINSVRQGLSYLQYSSHTIIYPTFIHMYTLSNIFQRTHFHIWEKKSWPIIKISNTHLRISSIGFWHLIYSKIIIFNNNPTTPPLNNNKTKSIPQVPKLELYQRHLPFNE